MMSKWIGIAALPLCAALLAGPVSAQGFEGEVAYKMTGDKGKPTEMVMAMKGTKMRTDANAEGHAMTMLIDAEGQVMKMLMPEQKMYMTMDLKGMREHMQQKKRNPPKVTDLGTRETIAGRSCENYVVETDDSKMEFCNTKGIGNFLSPRNPMGRGPSNGLSELDDEVYRTYFKDGFFPLRLTDLKEGKRRVIMEATRVEAKSFDASYFEVPAGFNEMKMPGMMGPPRQ
jgi:hypothetical protein